MSIYPCINGIQTLNQDILLYIFALNADMFADKGALPTTCITSRVCRSWRNLMFATPSLWARLIDMDCFSEEWCIEVIEELIQRSGAAPLWIRAKGIWLSDDIAEFLLCILEENWNRIQKLVVSEDYGDFNDNLFQLACKFPAPYLETFHLELAEYDDSADIIKAPPTALFGGHAPMLRRFCLDGYFIHQQEPWLHQLHSLVLTGKYHACDILAILTATHSLRKLQIEHYEDDSTLQSFPIVPLPQLRSLKFSGSPYRCTMLLDHIKIPLGCSLSISIHSLSEDLSIEETDKRHISVVDAFNRHARHFLKSAIFQAVSLSYLATLGNNYISMNGETISPMECRYSIEIEVAEKYTSTSNQLTIILNKLAQLDLSRTMTLDFSSSGPFNDPLIFASLSSINTLRVGRSSLEHLMALQEDEYSTAKPRILFPSLKTVDFTILSHFNSSFQPTDHVEVAIKFVLSRMRNGYPIAVLNMEKYWAFNPAPNLDALTECQDLKVCYKLQGMTGIFEHICGSGEPAEQI